MNTFCSTFVSRQKWKKRPRRGSTQKNKKKHHSIYLQKKKLLFHICIKTKVKKCPRKASQQYFEEFCKGIIVRIQ